MTLIMKFNFQLAIFIVFTITSAQSWNFDLKDNETTCIFARMNASFNIPYQMENGTEGTAHIRVPSNATISGVCAGDTDAAHLTLKFHSVFILNMTFSRVANRSYLDKMTFTFRYAQAYFPGLNKSFSDVTVTVKDAGVLPLSPSDARYTCMAPSPVTMTSAEVTLQLLMTELLLQAFDVQDGHMSDKEHDCLQDATTAVTTAVTTTDNSVTTPQPDAAGHWNLTSGGRQCLRAQMAIVIKIRLNDNQTVVPVTVPSSAVVDPTASHCGTDHSVLALSFLEDWSFQMTLQEKDEKVFVSGLLVHYKQNITEGLMKTANISGLELFKMNPKNYYKCNADKDAWINDMVTVNLAEMKLQAFFNDTESGFTGSEEECLSDENTSALVPIIVGASLAALVVLVLIFYAVCRKSRGSSYQSV